MISACANPACHIALDHRQGHFFRFHKAHRPGEQPPNTHSVQHFWLCGKCCEFYTLVYAEEHGVLLQDRLEIAAPASASLFVASA